MESSTETTETTVSENPNGAVAEPERGSPKRLSLSTRFYTLLTFLIGTAYVYQGGKHIQDATRTVRSESFSDA